MMGARSVLVRITVFAFLTVLVSACAQYSARSNKAPDFLERRLYVWSGIGGVGPFTKTLLFADDTFENLFNAKLTSKLSAWGVTNQLRSFSPSTDNETDLARFQRFPNIQYRLLIAPSKYTTITSRGVTNVDALNLDLSLVRIKDGRRVWRSEIVVNTNTAPGTAWREAGADRLAEQIVEVMRGDGLL